MSKVILFDGKARAKILRASNTLKKAVGSTLGPKGYNVAYDRPFGTPGVVHDGVTVAKELDSLHDPYECTVAKIIIDAAEKTNDQAGDGTTTAIVLTDALITEGFKLIAAGYNARLLRKGMELGAQAASDYLDTLAKPIKTDKELIEVAKISAQNDALGEIIGQVFKRLGKEAVTTIEDSNTSQSFVEYKDGMEVSQGFVSPYFMTDERLQEAVIQDANIIVTDRNLNDLNEFIGFFKALEKAEISNNLVIIGGDIQGQVLAMLVLNRVQGKLNVLGIKAPSFGDNQRDILEDIAVTTGARFISRESGERLDHITKQDIGHASRVVASKDTTTFVNGLGNQTDIETRVMSVKARLEKASSEFEMERLQERLAKLTTGIAIINVGSPTPAQTQEYKEAVIDAVSATKAALEQGIVAGGETALLKASLYLSGPAGYTGLSDDEQAGVRLVATALKQPFLSLIRNSGYDPGEKLAELKHKKITNEIGIDVIDGRIKDLLKAGIIDPVKVPKTALAHAVSTAGSLITTKTLIANDGEEKDAD